MKMGMLPAKEEEWANLVNGSSITVSYWINNVLALLTQADWDQLPLSEATVVAKGLESALGGLFEFIEIARCEQAGVAHNVAFFLRQNQRFALVIRSRGQVGWKPTSIENAHYIYSRDYSELTWRSPIELTLELSGCTTFAELANPPATYEQWLTSILGQPRETEIGTLLVAVEPQSALELVGNCRGDDPINVISRKLNSEGFRLPSSDEWEHLSNAGSDSLFRWGNVWPLGAVQDSVFSAHLARNAFGLAFSPDPYCPEFVQEESLMRAGDGGEMVCAGIGPLAWITFASSYVCRSQSILEDPEVWVESSLVRPVMEVEPIEF